MSDKGGSLHKYLWIFSTRSALYVLIANSFAESIFFPIPPDVLLMMMCLVQPSRSRQLALCSTISSVAGGILSYLVGQFLFHQAAERIINFYHYAQSVNRIEGLYFAYGPVIFFAKLFLPIPYKFVALASGQISLNLPMFLLLSFIIRGYRFFLLAGLTNLLGPLMLASIERRPVLILSILIALPPSISIIVRHILRL